MEYQLQRVAEVTHYMVMNKQLWKFCSTNATLLLGNEQPREAKFPTRHDTQALK
jgi:hypothetical protein